jgi:hypothetical protein
MIWSRLRLRRARSGARPPAGPRPGLRSRRRRTRRRHRDAADHTTGGTASRAAHATVTSVLSDDAPQQPDVTVDAVPLRRTLKVGHPHARCHGAEARRRSRRSMCGLVRRQPALQLTGLRHTPVLDAGFVMCTTATSEDVDRVIRRKRSNNIRDVLIRRGRRSSTYGTSDGRRCAI